MRSGNVPEPRRLGYLPRYTRPTGSPAPAAPRCDHGAVTTPLPIRGLTTPRAAAAAGVLFAVLFTTALVLLWTTVPDGGAHGAQWTVTGSGHLKVAATLMPFAGIAFLWFIGVVRDGF